MNLKDKTIINTRPDHQSAEFSSMLESFGAKVIELPMLKISPLADSNIFLESIDSLNDSDWIVFTSVNGVREAAKLFSNNIPKASVAAIGDRTGEVCRELSFNLSFVASDSNSEGFARELLDYLPENFSSKIFLLRGDSATDVLPNSLVKAGLDVESLIVYQSILVDCPEVKLREVILRADALTLTSARAASNIYQLVQNKCIELNEKLLSIPIYCIGSTTFAEVESLGFQSIYKSETPTIKALVETMKSY